MLTQLQEFIDQGQLEEVSLVYSVLLAGHQANAAFVLQRIPAMIFNRHKAIRDNLNRLSGTEKEKLMGEWAEQIRDAAADAGRLARKVDQIAMELESHSKPQPRRI